MIDQESYRAGLIAAAHTCMESATFINNTESPETDSMHEAEARRLIVRAIHQQAEAIRGLMDLGHTHNMAVANAAYMRATEGNQ